MASKLRVEHARDFMSIEEQEADYFARALLIPSHKLKEVIHKTGVCYGMMYPWDLVKFCSDYFDVPESVIRVRLKDLGYAS